MGVAEFQKGDLHIRLANEPMEVVRRPRDQAPHASGSEAVAEPVRPAGYSTLFNGKPPKFQRAV